MAEQQKSGSFVAPLVGTLIGVFVAWAGSDGGATVGIVPVFALVVALAYVIQWGVFIPSYLASTERFYDLTGSLTYSTLTVLAVLLSGNPDGRTFLLLAVVLIWAGRLGTFLFRRVRRAGKDDRFDTIKRSFPRFLTAWTIQALWITLTAGAALAAITATRRVPIDAFAIVGLLVWLAGFAMEATADLQKNRFRADPANKGRFISAGLWAVSRHPNYFGEIVLWIGVAIIAFPVLSGWQYVTLISPVFVYVLLTRISGIPLLERKAEATWGGQAEYEVYKQRTPVLVPFLGRRQR